MDNFLPIVIQQELLCGKIFSLFLTQTAKAACFGKSPIGEKTKTSSSPMNFILFFFFVLPVWFFLSGFFLSPCSESTCLCYLALQLCVSLWFYCFGFCYWSITNISHSEQMGQLRVDFFFKHVKSSLFFLLVSCIYHVWSSNHIYPHIPVEVQYQIWNHWHVKYFTFLL